VQVVLFSVNSRANDRTYTISLLCYVMYIVMCISYRCGDQGGVDDELKISELRMTAGLVVGRGGEGEMRRYLSAHCTAPTDDILLLLYYLILIRYPLQTITVVCRGGGGVRGCKK